MIANAVGRNTEQPVPVDPSRDHDQYILDAKHADQCPLPQHRVAHRDVAGETSYAQDPLEHPLESRSSLAQRRPGARFGVSGIRALTAIERKPTWPRQ